MLYQACWTVPGSKTNGAIIAPNQDKGDSQKGVDLLFKRMFPCLVAAKEVSPKSSIDWYSLTDEDVSNLTRKDIAQMQFDALRHIPLHVMSGDDFRAKVERWAKPRVRDYYDYYVMARSEAEDHIRRRSETQKEIEEYEKNIQHQSEEAQKLAIC